MGKADGGFMMAVAVPFIQHVLQGDTVQVALDGLIEAFPQIVREAGRAFVAIGLAAAAGGVQLVFGGVDDFGNVNAAGLPAEQIAAAGPAHAFYQPGAAQFAEKLFEVG